MAKRLQFDIPQIRKQLMEYFVKVMDRFLDTAMEYILQEIPTGPSYDWPLVWRQEVRAMFEKEIEKKQGDIIEGILAPKKGFSEGDRELAILNVLEYGTGEIYGKPGQMTWKKYMESKGPSGARNSNRIPQFEHPGIHFMENAKRRLQTRFNLEMEQAIENIPKSILLKNLRMM